MTDDAITALARLEDAIGEAKAVHSEDDIYTHLVKAHGTYPEDYGINPCSRDFEPLVLEDLHIDEHAIYADHDLEDLTW